MSAEQNIAYKKRFEVDRHTQELTPDETSDLNNEFDGGDEQLVFEEWQSQVALHIARNLGMIDHHTSSVGWETEHVLAKKLRSMPPIHIFQNSEVYTYAITDALHGCHAWSMHDELTGQYGPMTTDQSRKTNSSYNVWILVDLVRTVHTMPRGWEGPGSSEPLPPPTKKVTLASILQPPPSMAGSTGNGAAGSNGAAGGNGSAAGGNGSAGNGSAGNVPASKQSSTESSAAAKKKIRLKYKKEKRPPPVGWMDWPIRDRSIHNRIPIFQLPLQCMSFSDARHSGRTTSDAWLYESSHDHGGGYIQNDSYLYLPNPEGLKHNYPFVFASNKTSEMLGKTHWKYPDHNKPKEELEQDAIMGYLHHMNELSTLHMRCMHPRKTNKSTHTWNLKTTKFSKYEILSGNVLSTTYQFWDHKCEPTILFVAMGLPLNKIIPLIKKAAGQDWFESAFRIILDRLECRHPKYIQTQEEGLLYLCDIMNASPGASFKKNISNIHSAPPKKDSPNAYHNWTRERKLKTALDFLCLEFFPHVGLSPRYLPKKTFYLARCIHSILMKITGFRPFDLKDDYNNQRYDTNGILLSNLNRRCMGRFITRVEVSLRNFIKDQIHIHWPTVFDDTWTNEISSAFISGNWSPDKKSPGASRKNAAIRLQRYNIFGDIAHSRRCNATNRSQRKSNQSKQIDDAQYGRRDTSDTPEGPQCGVVQTFCCGSTLTEGGSTRAFMRVLFDLLGPDILQPVMDENEYMTHATFTRSILLLRDREYAESTELSSSTDASVKDTSSSSLQQQYSHKNKNKKKKKITSAGAVDAITTTTTTSTLPSSSASAPPASATPAVWWVQVDGGIHWQTRYPQKVLEKIRSLRRRGEIDPYISCELDGSLLSIRTMSGRNVRVLMYLKKLKAYYDRTKSQIDLTAKLPDANHWDFFEMRNAEIIDFMDGLEERALCVAYGPDDFRKRSQKWGEAFTHMEVEKAWGTDGINSILLPFPDHNQGPRKTLANSFLKQAFTNMDNPNRQWLQRMTLHNPQQSPCLSRGWRDYDLKRISVGPVVRKLLCPTRDNQDDAWRLNASSEEAGLFFSTRHYTYITGNRKSTAVTAQHNSTGVTSATIKTSTHNTALLTNNYDKIGLNAPTAAVDEHLEGGDVVIMRNMQQGAQYGEESELNEKMDDSMVMRTEHEGVVEHTLTISNENNAILINKVGVRGVLKDHIGNKFTSQHGQKGTKGADAKMIDNPFSCFDGCAGDFIGSVNSQTSRLTDGHMLQGEISTQCIFVGETVDATGYRTLSREMQRKKLEEKVLKYGGTLCPLQGFINGQTGELMQPLCIFDIQIKKLRHLAQEKHNTRPVGRRSLINRQATEGKSNDGGLKAGAMERDCLLSGGAAGLNDERMHKLSDPFTTAYCSNCEMPATYDEKINYRYCDLCCTGKFVMPVRTTHTTTLSLDELFALCITSTAKTVDENVPVTCSSSQWDERERKEHEERQKQTLYRLFTMKALDRSIYKKYGLQEPETLKTFLQHQPSLNRKSEYTNVLTKDSARFLPPSAVSTTAGTSSAVGLGVNVGVTPTPAKSSSKKKSAGTAGTAGTAGSGKDDTSSSSSAAVAAANVASAASTITTTTTTTRKKRKSSTLSSVPMTAADLDMEARNEKMNNFLALLAPVKRSRRFNSGM